MAITYSVYKAKARFSEVIRQVRAGKTVIVSYRGEPVYAVAQNYSVEDGAYESDNTVVLIGTRIKF